VVVPSFPESLRTTLDGYKKFAEKLNIAGAEAKKAGMKLSYHNHNFEFKDWGEGKMGYDVMMKETDPSLVSFEMDIYWVTRAGQDPLKIIKENPGRISLWHVKDMAEKVAPSTGGGEQYFTEVGSGIIDYVEIFKHKKESGMQYFFVEQDQVKLPVYESITKSFEYIKKNLVK
jgi:sugar phosphate isomerase/epimerase